MVEAMQEKVDSLIQSGTESANKEIINYKIIPNQTLKKFLKTW